MVVYTKHENVLRLLITEMIKKKKWTATKKRVDLIYNKLENKDYILQLPKVKKEIDKLISENILHFSK